MKIIFAVFALIFILGCAGQQPALVPEKHSKERFTLLRAGQDEKEEKLRFILSPQKVSAARKGIEVAVKYTSYEQLENFFRQENIFGKPRKNPYHPEVIVFSLKIVNNSGGKIKVEPREFIIVDDLNSQRSSLSPEYIAALHDKNAISMFAETGAQYAPGFYSAPFGVARRIASSSFRKRSSLLREVALSGGYVYDKVIYEGHISFFRPNPGAKTLTLILPDIKTDFDADAKATDAIDFRFTFDVTYDIGDKSK